MGKKRNRFTYGGKGHTWINMCYAYFFGCFKKFSTSVWMLFPWFNIMNIQGMLVGNRWKVHFKKHTKVLIFSWKNKLYIQNAEKFYSNILMQSTHSQINLLICFLFNLKNKNDWWLTNCHLNINPFDGWYFNVGFKY